MPRYLIRRDLGDITEAQLEIAADTSTRVRVERFSDIVHERSHVVRAPAGGVVAYCVYAADDEQRLRDHAAAAGIPLDELLVIERELLP